MPVAQRKIDFWVLETTSCGGTFINLCMYPCAVSVCSPNAHISTPKNALVRLSFARQLKPNAVTEPLYPMMSFQEERQTPFQF